MKLEQMSFRMLIISGAFLPYPWGEGDGGDLHVQPLAPAPACTCTHPGLPPPGQEDQKPENRLELDPKIPLCPQYMVSPDQVDPGTEAEERILRWELQPHLVRLASVIRVASSG